MMKKQVLEYRKTDHFLFSQWDRKVDDTILYKILPFVKHKNHEKTIVLVMPSFLKRKGVLVNDQNSLIFIIKHKTLLTTYWCNHPNYLFNKEKKANFQIIY